MTFLFSSLVLPLPHTQRRKKSTHQRSDAFFQAIRKIKYTVGRQRAAIPPLCRLSQLSLATSCLCLARGKHFITQTMAEEALQLDPQLRSTIFKTMNEKVTNWKHKSKSCPVPCTRSGTLQGDVLMVRKGLRVWNGLRPSLAGYLGSVVTSQMRAVQYQEESVQWTDI